MNLNDLELGSTKEITLLVRKIENATSSNGLTYQKLLVRDREEHETVLFNFEDRVNVKAPFIAKINVETDSYREAKSHKLKRIEIQSNADMNPYMPKSEIDARESWKTIVILNKELRPVLRKVVGRVLSNNMEKFCVLPLSQSKAYARQNGILEATVCLTQLAQSASKTFASLDRDLLLAGAIVYYVGAVDLLDAAYNENPNDALIGIAVSSHDKLIQVCNHYLSLSEDADEMELAMKKLIMEGYEDIRSLNHILLSRTKGIPAALPEALVLRHLDQIVTDVDWIRTGLQEAEPGTVMRMNGIRIYRTGEKL